MFIQDHYQSLLSCCHSPKKRETRPAPPLSNSEQFKSWFSSSLSLWKRAPLLTTWPFCGLCLLIVPLLSIAHTSDMQSTPLSSAGSAISSESSCRGLRLFLLEIHDIFGSCHAFSFSPASSSDPKLRIKKTLKWARLFVQTTIYDRWTTICNEFHLSFSSNYTKRSASCLTLSDSFFSQKFWRLLHCSRQPIQRFLYSIS